MNQKILVVEDDEIVREVILGFLTEKGYQTKGLAEGTAVLTEIESFDPDLLLLDVMLPGKSGLTILKELRQTSKLPVIMLTAMEDEYTQLVSFNLEITDYVTKPFLPSILVKRVENALRSDDNKEIRFDTFVIDLENYTAIDNGVLISLTKKEFDILAALAKRHGRVVSREQLVMQVWGYDTIGEERVLDNHMKNLRKKIPLGISTIKGIGYRLEV